MESGAISAEQDDAESSLCGWTKHLIKLGVAPEVIHGQVDRAISEAYEEIEFEERANCTKE